jgi:RNA polymerase sigma-70 factor, ECF subfamily
VAVLSPGKSASRPHKPAVYSTKAVISRFVLQDRELVDRCLANEPTAWSQMYDRFHGPLLASIRAFLGKTSNDVHLIDEVSARVWYSLVRNDCDLLAKFDVQRGCRLSTFLSVLAKTEARLLLRSERRRKSREQVASKPEIADFDDDGIAVLSDEEFIETLSPAERAFYFEVLIPFGDMRRESQYSRQNNWQLRHRIRKKLQQYLK